jgi:hypothetical protein
MDFGDITLYMLGESGAAAQDNLCSGCRVAGALCAATKLDMKEVMNACFPICWMPGLRSGLRCSALTLLAFLVACGGGANTPSGTDSAVGTTPPVSVPLASAGTGAACTLPALPGRPNDALDVRSFGAIPDDGLDDTLAIQSAIRALAPGQWLVFPAGVYQHDRRLDVRTPRVVLWAEGATLHATNPDDQAVMLGADGVSIYNFTLTAVTGVRLYAPWHARIAIYDSAQRGVPLLNNVVRGNRVVNGGAAGSATANSASAAGIYVEFADGFTVMGNEVRRSLADGIHITGGARNGRVLLNSVQETGDDGVATVSYMGQGDWRSDSAASLAAALDSARDRQLVRNILVADNDIRGSYFGRGISVVGGKDVIIRNNRVSDTALAAGILVAREASFVTWGVDNVLIDSNTVIQVQTMPPSYTPVGWDLSLARTGHGGVEIHSSVFDDERQITSLAAALAVQRIQVTRNTVADTWAAGVRVGTGTGETFLLRGVSSRGQPVARSMSGGRVTGVEVSSLTTLRVGQEPVLAAAATPSADQPFCQAVTEDGVAAVPLFCSGPRPSELRFERAPTCP